MKKISHARLLKKNGSWIYCSECNNTVGYLCYTTYEYFKYNFFCQCGNKGEIIIGEYLDDRVVSDDELITIKNRLCCPLDSSPLFSVVEKNIEGYNYEIVCKKCKIKYYK